MIIEKEVKTIVRFDTGEEIKKGQFCMFSTTTNACSCGIYDGIDSRGCLMFISFINADDVAHIYAKSIRSIKNVAINILD